jgi:DNA-binding NtrC family response regulator
LSAADGGTLFLSQTGNIAPALRDRVFSRLAARRRPERGGNAPVDVRVVIDLVSAAEGDRDPGSVLGTLRNVLGAVVIEVPSICEHSEELPSLIAYLAGVSELRLSRHPRG